MRPRYLPIDEPIGRPTVHPFGKDFGHGAIDRLHFQASEVWERAGIATEAYSTEARDEAVHRAALTWLDDTLARDRAIAIEPDDDSPLAKRYATRLAHVAEDLVVVQRGAGEGRIVGVHVRSPSGWWPEKALFGSLTTLHQEVPGLLDRASGERLTRMMIDRGPYVRFVWGLSTSDELDHHPDRVVRPSWEDSSRAYLRIERQSTVPLAHVEAALFVLRVYVEPVDSLTKEERARLWRALSALSPALRQYKGLPQNLRILDRLIGR